MACCRALALCNICWRGGGRIYVSRVTRPNADNIRGERLIIRHYASAPSLSFSSANSFPFDFIIGSTHTFHKMDAEDKRHYEGVDIQLAVSQYFEEELENIKRFQVFDVAGHMDFVLRYGPGALEQFTYAKYADILDL